MSTRLADQPAILEWVSGVRAAGHHQPLLPTHERVNCETVSAAVDYAKTRLPETYRTTATITAAGVTLQWGDIERWDSPPSG